MNRSLYRSYKRVAQRIPFQLASNGLSFWLAEPDQADGASCLVFRLAWPPWELIIDSVRISTFLMR